MRYTSLHTHSTFSDGVYTPEKLVELGKEIGHKAMLLTDEQIEELRKEAALSAFDEVTDSATQTFIALLMLPFIPVMLIVPVFGWVTSAAALMSPISLLMLPFKFFAACFAAGVCF